jgi:hemoglobin
MTTQPFSTGPATVPAARPYYLTIASEEGIPHPDADGINEGMIQDVVHEFYRRARRDERLGPVFESYVDDWDRHLSRMVDFWSAALLRTGRYSGHPVEIHRGIVGLNRGHFDRWVELFEETVRDLCPSSQAEAFLIRARRMRDGMTKILI